MISYLKQHIKIICLLTIVALFAFCTKQDGITPNWPKKAELPGSGRRYAVSFTIADKAYIGTGYNGSHLNDFWQYDAASNTWVQKSDFGGTARQSATGFSIGTKGYLGMGWAGDQMNDMWEYDPSANTWIQKASLPDSVRNHAAAFVIGSKAYIGTGWSGYSYLKDFWEFSPDSPDSTAWKKKSDFPGSARYRATAFSIGNKGYMGSGKSYQQFESDFYEYDATSDLWIQIAKFPTPRDEAAAFVIGSKAYVGTGYDGSAYKKDLWEFDPSTNKWTEKVDFTGMSRLGAVGFSLAGHGYIGTGYNDNGSYEKSFFEYFP